MRDPDRYTRESLQREADRWALRLRAMGYELPHQRINVYTSVAAFDAAVGAPSGAERDLGQARMADGGRPIIYVRLPAAERDRDALTVLIHELLQHVRPALSHAEVYGMADSLRAAERCRSGRERDLTALEMQVMVDRFEKGLEQLWLEANGFPSDD